MPTCPKCRAPQPEKNAFCDRCGAALTLSTSTADNTRICSICRTPALPGQDFCPNCGAPFNNPTANTANNIPHCALCGQPVNPTVGYCDRCGASLTPPPAARPCPRCGAANAVDSRFCESCGQKLEPAATGIAAAGSLPPTVKIPVGGGAKSPDIGLPPTVKIAPGSQDPTQPVNPPISTPRLVVLGTAAVLPLVVGKIQWIVGRKDPNTGTVPDVDLTNYGGEAGGVSRRHARIVRQGDQMFIEDLNTINHSYLNNQCLAPGKLYPLNEGDEIRLGRIKLTFYIQSHPDSAGRPA